MPAQLSHASAQHAAFYVEADMFPENCTDRVPDVPPTGPGGAASVGVNMILMTLAVMATIGLMF